MWLKVLFVVWSTFWSLQQILARNAGSKSGAHWCAVNRTVSELDMISPRQEHAVTCLDLYRHLQEGWKYDDQRMKTKHGDQNNVTSYFHDEGDKALCYVYKPIRTKLRKATKIVLECCSGWQGGRCDTPTVALGLCFDDKQCLSPQDRALGGISGLSLTSHVQRRAFTRDACCSLLSGSSWKRLGVASEGGGFRSSCRACNETRAEDKRNERKRTGFARKSCVTWGHHVSGFGGEMRSVSTNCALRLAGALDNSWWIDIQHDSRNSNRTKVGVHFGDDAVITLTKNVIYIDEIAVTLVSLLIHKGITLKRSGEFILLRSPLGIKMKYNAETVTVSTDDNSRNARGLCGSAQYIEDLYTEDIVTPNDPNSTAQTRRCESKAVFPPQENVCSTSIGRKQAESVCDLLRNSEAFGECRETHDVTSFYRACVSDVCSSNADLSGSNSICATATSYMLKCTSSDVVVSPWMEEANCSHECPTGMVFRDCVTSCPKTCDFMDDDSAPVCHDDCVPGCQCPEGKILHRETPGDDVTATCVAPESCPCKHRGRFYARGSQVVESCNTCTCAEKATWSCSTNRCEATCHVIAAGRLVTFDETRLMLNDLDCPRHVLLQTLSDASSQFRISMDIVQSISPTNGAAIRSVVVNFNSDEIWLTKSMAAFLNGTNIMLPFRNKHYSIRRATTHAMVVRTFGLEIIWSPEVDALDITLEPVYANKVVGLCGTYNWNPKDDFTTPEGGVETVAELFIQNFKLSENNDKCAKSDMLDVGLNIDDPCATHTQKREMASRVCGIIFEPLFQDCFSLVDKDIYVAACHYDVCSNDDVTIASACRSISSYATACMQFTTGRNTSLEDWRRSASLEGACDVACPSGLEFVECQAIASSSCSDIYQPLPFYGRAEERDRCSPGCACPGGWRMAPRRLHPVPAEEGSISRGLSNRGFPMFGQVMTCLPKVECPCVTNGEEHRAGSVIHRGCAKCICSFGRWNCSSRGCDATVRCANNMIYSRKMTPCDAVTCANFDKITAFRDRGDCNDEMSYEGCKCPEQMVLEDNRCIPVEDCPCHHSGAVYKTNDTIVRDCNTCVCRNRRWQCTDRKCSAHCVATGDPHYVTFDGAQYSFQGSCSYVLSRENGGLFTVTAENLPCGTTGVTCTKSIYVRVGSTMLHMLKGKRITINGAPIARFPRRYGDDVSYMAIDRAGPFVVASWPDVGLSVFWDGGTRVAIQLRPRHMSNVSGLCGNYDRSSRNDFTTRQGSLEAMTSSFTDSWRVSSACPETPLAADTLNPCKANPHRTSWARQKCSIISTGSLFAECRTVVPHVTFYNWCVTDACACDSGGDCECVCTAVAAYSHECNRNRVAVRWRTQDFCPMQCDGGQRYMACGSVCQETCRYRGPEMMRHCDELPCVEGCFCPQGSVLHSGKCVKTSSCPCFYEGGEYPNGTRITKNCQNCSCQEGQWKCEGEVCDSRVSSCGDKMFRCTSEFQCVSNLWRCDQEEDCADGSDEVGCNHTRSDCMARGGHYCDAGSCHSAESICDGKVDCDDMSDELNCGSGTNTTACGSKEFSCSSGVCIPDFLFCDGKFDCGFADYSDESGCEQNCSILYHFACDDGQCLIRTAYCDGTNDCPSGEDESSCFCPPSHFTCADGSCVDRGASVCDGVDDCMQGEDEFDCTTATMSTTTEVPNYETTASSLPSCPQFHCDDNHMICLPWKRVCDNVNDCPDNSDETEYCWRGCRKGEFSCDGGSRCIDSRLLCDGLNHCIDKSDETHESCAGGNGNPHSCLTGFMCDDEVCINGTMVCDGVEHCTYADDERNCPSDVTTTPIPATTSPTTMPHCGGYSCLDGKCIELNKVCNGMDECLDGNSTNANSSFLVLRFRSSDEAGCSTWSNWEEWGSCSVNCGSGTQQRNRTCDRGRDGEGNVIAAQDDPLKSQCKGRGSITRPCFLEVCRNETETLTPWSDWSECTVTCGGGLSSRWRACADGTTNCSLVVGGRRGYGVPLLEIRSCSQDVCPDRNCAGNKIYRDCDAVSSNGRINPCPLTCRDYVRGGDASCVSPTTSCQSGCYCPYGHVLRNETHTECVPAKECPCYVNGKRYDIGEEVRRKELCQICQCTGSGRLGDCIEDPNCDDSSLCGWTDWSSWGPCFGPCGVNGVQWAFRSPLHPSRYGRPQCRGTYRKSKRCPTDPCPSCDVTDDSGVTTRKSGEQWRYSDCRLCACAENGTVTCQRYCELSVVGCPNNSTLIEPRDGCCYCQDLTTTISPISLVSSTVTSLSTIQPKLVTSTIHRATTATQSPLITTAAQLRQIANTTTSKPTRSTNDHVTSAWETSTSASNCGPHKFQCSNSGECIDRMRLCDGVTDCPDVSDEDAANCDVDNGDVICLYGEWSSWSGCSSSCDVGQMSRHRGLTPRLGNRRINDSDCLGPFQQQRICFETSCPLDGAWSSWRQWSRCSLSCGGGVQVRQRSCDSPGPQNGGAPCPGVSVETKVCNSMPCHPGNCKGGRLFVNGSHCAGFEACAQTCADLSSKVRCRSECLPHENLGGCFCSQGSYLQDGACVTIDQCRCTVKNKEKEPGSRFNVGGCDCSCVKGRTSCQSNCSVDCGWSRWSSWSRCDRTCGSDGRVHRFRSPSNPSKSGPQGRDCEGSRHEIRPCSSASSDPCPSFLSPWTQWSQCSSTCGVGRQFRRRKCQVERGEVHISNCRFNGEASTTQTRICTESSTSNSSCSTCSPDASFRCVTCTGSCDDVASDVTVGSSCFDQCRWTCACPDGLYLQNGRCIPISGCKCNLSRYRPLFGVTTRMYLNPGESVNWDCNQCTCNSGKVACTNRTCGEPGWLPWSQWSTCSRPCVDIINGSVQAEIGTSRRFRHCNLPDDETCAGEELQTVHCGLSLCPKKVAWTEWSQWSRCDRSCNGGVQVKRRSCRSQGTEGCPGQSHRVRSCNKLQCRDGGCPAGATLVKGCKSCNKVSTCLGLNNDFGDDIICDHDNVTDGNASCDVERCACRDGLFLQNGACVPREQCNCYAMGTVRRPATHFFLGRCTMCVCVNGVVTCTTKNSGTSSCVTSEECDDITTNNVVWSEWSTCTRSCGVGIQRRFGSFQSRYINQYINGHCNRSLVEQRDCSTTACAGTNSNCTDLTTCGHSWSSWGSCSTTCVNGNEHSWRHRYRQCLQGSFNCTTTVETSRCDNSSLPHCPSHVTWSGWSVWSQCSVTCQSNTTQSASFRTRRRKCEQKANAGHCAGKSVQVAYCETNNTAPPCDDNPSPPITDDECHLLLPGSRHSDCRPICTKSCFGEEVCAAFCTPGCHCPAGLVLARDFKSCVERDQCGCYDAMTGIFHAENSSVIHRQPIVRRCSCSNGSLRCENNGEWCGWSHWSSCDERSCSRHERKRVRSCACSAPVNHDGTPLTCETTNDVTRINGSVQTQTSTCPRSSRCPTDPDKPSNWGGWGAWAECTCDSPYSVRRRHCVTSLPCDGIELQTKPCRWNIGRCGLTCPPGLVLSPCESFSTSKEVKSCLGLSPKVQCLNGNEVLHEPPNRERRWDNCIPQCTCPKGLLLSPMENSNKYHCVEPENCPCFLIEKTSVIAVNRNHSVTRDCTTCRCERRGYIDCQATTETNCTNGTTQGWDAWTGWSSCSVTCNGGTQQRQRNCFLDRNICVGSRKEMHPCNQNVSCTMDTWQSWSGCSQSCGGTRGIRMRSRNCRQGSLCVEEELRQISRCNVSAPCPPSWTHWSSWSDCSQSCEAGTQSRQRGCSNKLQRLPALECNPTSTSNATETRPCFGKSCNNGTSSAWSAWQPWSSCRGSCGKGVQTRFRGCGKVDLKEGYPCSGSYNETRPCRLAPCPNVTTCPPEMTLRQNCDDCRMSASGLTERLPRACHELTADSAVQCDQDECSHICVCEPGKVLQLDEDESNQCVNAHQCECLDAKGNRWHSGASWVTTENDDMGNICRANCTCLVGLVVCGEDKCQVSEECEWSEWGSWSSCNSSCADSIPSSRIRHRTSTTDTKVCEQGDREVGSCDQMLPPCGQCGGAHYAKKTWNEGECTQCFCTGNRTETCQDICWTDWSEWSQCDASCGANATQTRSRKCTSHLHCNADVTSIQRRHCTDVPPCYGPCHGVASCPEVRCRDGKVKRRKPEECCESCQPEEDNRETAPRCEARNEMRNLTFGGCVSHNTEIRYCAGRCHSSVHLLPYEPFLHATCECCAPLLDQPRAMQTVTLTCPDGEKRHIDLPRITSCSCQACSDNSALKTADP